MPRDLSKIYSAEWVKSFDGFEREYEAIVESLDEEVLCWFNLCTACRKPFGPNEGRAVDLGCGPGLLLRELQRLRWHVTGYDGSRPCLDACDPELKPFVHHRDLLSDSPLEHELPVDLAICTEVAEHVPFEGADRLVERLDALGAPLMLWSSASPGQGGHDHVNEQPWSYWRTKFQARGIVCDLKLTEDFLEPLRKVIVKQPWVLENSRILVRA